MDYRNERDALRGRVENLEQELGEAKREHDAHGRRQGGTRRAAREASRGSAGCARGGPARALRGQEHTGCASAEPGAPAQPRRAAAGSHRRAPAARTAGERDPARPRARGRARGRPSGEAGPTTPSPARRPPCAARGRAATRAGAPRSSTTAGASGTLRTWTATARPRLRRRHPIEPSSRRPSNLPPSKSSRLRSPTRDAPRSRAGAHPCGAPTASRWRPARPASSMRRSKQPARTRTSETSKPPAESKPATAAASPPTAATSTTPPRAPR